MKLSNFKLQYKLIYSARYTVVRCVVYTEQIYIVIIIYCYTILYIVTNIIINPSKCG